MPVLSFYWRLSIFSKSSEWKCPESAFKQFQVYSWVFYTFLVRSIRMIFLDDGGFFLYVNEKIKNDFFQGVGMSIPYLRLNLCKKKLNNSIYVNRTRIWDQTSTPASPAGYHG